MVVLTTGKHLVVVLVLHKPLLMFSSTSAIDFAKAFPDNEACYAFLDSIKWKDGYHCYKCGCRRYIKGRTSFHRRCRDCGYDESLTANTLFHDMRMPVKKAFYMLFTIGTRLKGMSTAELARMVHVQQRTGWLFKRKMQVGMQRSADQMAFFELLLCSLNQRIEDAGKTQCKKKKQRKNSARRSCLRQHRFAKAEAGRHNNPQTGKMPIIFLNFLGTNYHGWSYPGTGNQQMLFNGWLGGIHHKCAAALHPCYCDEFAYRFERRENRENIFSMLVTDMLRSKPHPYSVLKLVRA